MLEENDAVIVRTRSLVMMVLERDASHYSTKRLLFEAFLGLVMQMLG